MITFCFEVISKEERTHSSSYYILPSPSPTHTGASLSETLKHDLHHPASYKRFISLDQENERYFLQKNMWESDCLLWSGSLGVGEWYNRNDHLTAFRLKNFGMFCVKLTSLCWSRAKEVPLGYHPRCVCLLSLPFLSSLTWGSRQPSTEMLFLRKKTGTWKTSNPWLTILISYNNVEDNLFARLNISLPLQKPYTRFTLNPSGRKVGG